MNDKSYDICKSGAGVHAMRGVSVRASELWSTGCELNSRPCTAGLVLGWVTDRLWAGKPSQYVTGHLGQLSLPFSVVGKFSTGLSGWG